MTPIQPNTGSIPLPSQGSQQRSEKLQELAGKVAEATGGSAPQEVTKASVPKGTATTTSVPDPQKTAAAVKQSLIKEMNLETLLNIAKPVRNIILTGLTDIELNSFEIALSRGKDLQESEKLAFEALKKQIDEIKQDRLLKEILADHPEWKVEAWKGVSVEDKIWLLQLYELRDLGVVIPQIDAAPSAATLSLLEPSTKKAIIEGLAKVTELNCFKKGLRKCPKAIGLLVNLQKLDLNKNQLSAPPDISRNVNLQKLYLGGNELTALPDVSRNVNLQILYLNHNKLTAPPDVSRNVNLQELNVSFNKLTAPPDVSRNVNLQELLLNYNQLTAPPDVSRNVNLQILYLNHNKLTAPPDVSQNVNLQELLLNINQLTAPPDVSHNVNLQYLNLTNNQLTAPPDASRNVNLKGLYLTDNKLTANAKTTLATLKSERTNLKIEF